MVKRVVRGDESMRQDADREAPWKEWVGLMQMKIECLLIQGDLPARRSTPAEDPPGSDRFHC